MKKVSVEQRMAAKAENRVKTSNSPLKGFKCKIVSVGSWFENNKPSELARTYKCLCDIRLLDTKSKTTFIPSAAVYSNDLRKATTPKVGEEWKVLVKPYLSKDKKINIDATLIRKWEKEVSAEDIFSAEELEVLMHE